MCVPRRNPFDVEIRKLDEDARPVGAVEQIVALDVAWVQTGEVGWRERAVRRRFVVERERAVCFNPAYIHIVASALVVRLRFIVYTNREYIVKKVS